MSKSQNGWPVIKTYGDKRLRQLPTITGAVLDGPVYTIFAYLTSRFNSEVEKITRGHSWGFAPRAVRGYPTVFSNHASATAIDLNAPKHPMGKRNTFTAKQRRAIEAILKDLGGVVRWGGHYTNRPDEMHFEINANRSAVEALAKKLAHPVTNKPSPAKPKPPQKKPTSTNKKLSEREVHNLAVRTIRGEFGNGHDRRRKAIGSEYERVRAKVNQLMRNGFK